MTLIDTADTISVTDASKLGILALIREAEGGRDRIVVRNRRPVAAVGERLCGVRMGRRTAARAASHSARLLSRGVGKVAQKFGEEAIECLIESVAGNQDALIAESADVLYHLIVLWVASGVRPEQVWSELIRREGVSGIAEKASRVRDSRVAFGLNTTKIP